MLLRSGASRGGPRAPEVLTVQPPPASVQQTPGAPLGVRHCVDRGPQRRLPAASPCPQEPLPHPHPPPTPLLPPRSSQDFPAPLCVPPPLPCITAPHTPVCPCTPASCSPHPLPCMPLHPSCAPQNPHTPVIPPAPRACTPPPPPHPVVRTSYPGFCTPAPQLSSFQAPALFVPLASRFSSACLLQPGSGKGDWGPMSRAGQRQD